MLVPPPDLVFGYSVVLPSTKCKIGASYSILCSGVHLMLQNSDDLTIIISVQKEIPEGKYLDHNYSLII
jgi:hypothetical protein